MGSTRILARAACFGAIAGAFLAAGAGLALAIAVDSDVPLAIAKIDRRFQSCNIEILEVTGGRFWKRYKDIQTGAISGTPGTGLYEYRPPIDLTRPRLRKLAAALGRPIYA